ncbi:MAG TPA: hypothetical protein VFK07_01700 [Candidatus Paceibacterota bacterium]|nr:hypothetical protein [Candidatus Paceibacterota bacterium]
MTKWVIRLLGDSVEMMANALGAGAEFAIETFVTYAEFLVRNFIWSLIGVLAGIVLLKLNIRFKISFMLPLGMMLIIVSGAWFYIVSSPARIALEKIGEKWPIVRQELERLYNFLFLGLLTIFYLSLDQAWRFPKVMLVFLGILGLLMAAAIINTPFSRQIQHRLKWLVLIPAILLTVFAAVPQAVMNRIINSHAVERATGTVASEIPYGVDNQGRIINCAPAGQVNCTSGPIMDLFDQIGSDKNGPRPIKGWTRDQNGHYRIYSWFEDQKNYAPTGEEILPMTLGVRDSIIAQRKMEIQAQQQEQEQKEALAQIDQQLQEKQQQSLEEEKRLEELHQAEKNAHKKATEAEKAGQAALAELQRQKETGQQEKEARDKARLANQPVKVTAQIASVPKGQESNWPDRVPARLSQGFSLQGTKYIPDQSVVVMYITDVQQDPGNKNNYLVTLQPEAIQVGSVAHNILNQASPVQLVAPKEGGVSRFFKAIIPTVAGAVVGGVADGKKGAVIGAAAGAAVGAALIINSHGKKFRLQTGQTIAFTIKK